MRVMKLSALWVVAVAFMLPLSSSQQTRAEILLDEQFSEDVIGSGSWISSDPSVSVDTENGWLHTDTNGAHNDFADKEGPFPPRLAIA